MAEPTPGTAPVTDHRPTPKGVLPRRLQLWLMVGLTLVVLGIIAIGGRPAPTAASVAPTPTTSTAPDPSRLQDFGNRLRVLDERVRAQRLADPPPATSVPPLPTFAPTTSAASPDPLQAERRRREYESLFASNLVFTQRPEAKRFVTDRGTASDASTSRPSQTELPAPPDLEEVANAVVRATSRYAPPAAPATDASQGTTPAKSADMPPTPSADRTRRPASTGPISSAGPLHRLLEGTVIDTVLTNRVEGSAAAPVNCLVTSPVYSHDGAYVLIPAGSRVLGETTPVQAFGETRLAVTFNRLVLPDGSTFGLDRFTGLDEIGETGLRDQVNQHYRSTFGASGAVGLITGFAQYLGTLGMSRGNGGTVVIAGNVGDTTAQATAQTLNRFLNRMPTITIREGHRVKVYLTSDLELPAYGTRDGLEQPRLAAIH